VTATSAACRILESPIGLLALVGDAAGLHAIVFEQHFRDSGLDRTSRSVPTLLDSTARQLDEYFGGRRTRFDLQLSPRGTPFQLQVWSALADIPFGQTRSYGEIANTIGRPTASRAVGAANGRNPLPIVVPCHRVIGANGSLTGFAGGLDVKRRLLALERAR